MSDEKSPKNSSSDGWEMPEPVYRVSEGRTLGADAQGTEDVDTLEHDTVEPNKTGGDSHGYGQDSPDRPMLGPGGKKDRGIGCLILKIVVIILILGALILGGLFATGVGYYFSSGSQSNTIN